ncbi:AbiU2 domain-containing protein [Pseudomonas sp. EA_35y_Pfl2_R111]|uniref:AbiU2 domain-containing protein n=1 Tax=Pseudomonas sp. EA_35y_Pfl2_R111 TaxID=3088689 RepID=UPI0030D957C6
MPQILKMVSVIAKLQTTLDVYEGLFAEKNNAEITINNFHEIGNSIKNALRTHIIIGCAALFSDPSRTCGNENMSLKNLIEKNESKLSASAIALKNEIFNLVENMNLKKFRNKHVGHFGLEEMLGFQATEAEITVSNVRLLLEKSQKFINILIHDAQIMPQNESLGFYSKIPNHRSTDKFLARLKGHA